MNFRFAHYDPPKEDKKRPRRLNNASKTSNSKISARPTKANGTGKQRADSGEGDGLIRKPQKPPQGVVATVPASSQREIRLVPLSGASDVNHSASRASRDDDRNSDSSSIITRTPSSSSEHKSSSFAPNTTATPSSYSDPPRLPSLVTVLGEGRIDPFHIYPVNYVTPYVQMLIDHAFTHKWPNVSPVPSSSANASSPSYEVHPVKRAWLQCVLNHPVSFYALLYASSKHLAFLYNGHEEHFSHASLLRLSYKTEAVKLINESLRNLNGQPIPDHLLIAILSLGAHGNDEKRSPSKKLARSPPSTTHVFLHRSSESPETSTSTPTSAPPRQTPLARAQMLHFYGRMDQEAAHMSALRTLIKHNNGTKSIALSGLAGAVELGDILNSTITHRRPCVAPPTPITRSVRPFLPRDIAVLPIKPSALPPGRQSIQLLEAILLCKAVAGALEAYVDAREADGTHPVQRPQSQHPPSTTTSINNTITLTDLTISRNAAHYAILSLPPANPLWGAQFALYEALRLATLIFSDLVLFPLPDTTGVRRRYVGLLREALDCCWASGIWVDEVKGLGWCAGMGVAAAAGGEGAGEVEGQGGEGGGGGRWAWADEGKGGFEEVEEDDVTLFIRRMRTSFDLLGAGTWEGVEAWLDRWLWWDWLLGERMRGLWEARGQGGGKV